MFYFSKRQKIKATKIETKNENERLLEENKELKDENKELKEILIIRDQKN